MKSVLLRSLAAALCAVILCTGVLSSTVLAQTITYPDIKAGAWYAQAVEYVAEAGFMTGYQNGKFGPSDKLQRQDFIVILARVGEVDLDAYSYRTGGMLDVKQGSYFAPSVAWAINNAVSTGYQSGKFGVGDAITREQVCTILWRYMGSPSVSNAAATLKGYPDYADVSAFATNAMAWALNNGIVSGMSDGQLAPLANASRAQIATILMRIDQQGMFEPYEETMNGASAWAMQYHDFIIEDIYAESYTLRDHAHYTLMFINDDAIPEIWIDYGIWAAGGRLATYYKNNVTSEKLDAGFITYAPRQNRFYQSSGKMGYYYDTVYKLQKGYPYVLSTGTYEDRFTNGYYTNIYDYTWNGAPVSASAYQANLDTLVPPSVASRGVKTFDYYGILSYLAAV